MCRCCLLASRVSSLPKLYMSGFVQNIPTGFPELSRAVCSSVSVGELTVQTMNNQLSFYSTERCRKVASTIHIVLLFVHDTCVFVQSLKAVNNRSNVTKANGWGGELGGVSISAAD